VNINLNGYKLIANEDSLWLLKDEGVRMGIRREWRNSQGKVIGVDICKLESNAIAEDTALERKKKMWIDYLVSEEPKGITVHDNTVIHVYYLNHEFSIYPAYYLPPVSSSRKPIYYDRLGLPFFYYNNPYYNPVSYYSRFPASPYNNISLKYPYNASLYQPNLSSYIWNSSMPFYKTPGYNYSTYYPERYALPVNPRESYGGYIFPYGYDSPFYSYSFSNPYPALPSGIFNMLASSNLNTTLKGIELMHNYWPPF
ncbi:MAG: hypothetical protein ACMUHX_07990, partial [bacterium]